MHAQSPATVVGKTLYPTPAVVFVANTDTDVRVAVTGAGINRAQPAKDDMLLEIQTGGRADLMVATTVQATQNPGSTVAG